MAVKGEASKQGFAERHSAVLWTVLVPRFQKVFYEGSNTLLKAALQVTDLKNITLNTKNIPRLVNKTD